MQKKTINYQMVNFICKSNPVIVFIILLFFVSTLFFPIIPAYSITTTQVYSDENFYYANDNGVFKFTLFNNENSTIIVNQAKIMLSYNLDDGSSFVSVFGESQPPLQFSVAPQEYKSFSVPFDINGNASPGYASIIIMYIINGTYWNNATFLFSTNPLYIESDWKTQYGELDESYDQLSSNYTALDKNYTNLNTTYTILYSDTELLKKQVSSLQSEFKKINEELLNLEDEYSILNSDYDDLLTDYENLETDNLIIASQYDQLVDQYQMIFDEYNKISLTHHQLSMQYSELLDNYQTILSEYNKLSLNYQILNSEHALLLKNYENLKFQYDDIKTTELIIQQEFEKSQIPVNKSNSDIFFDEFRKLVVIDAVTDQPSLQQPNDSSLQNQLNHLVSLKSERDNFEFYLYITIIVAIILIVMTYNITNYKLKKNKFRSNSASDIMTNLDQESINSVKEIKKALSLWDNKENNFLVKGYDNKNLQSIYVIKKIQDILKDWKDKE